MAPLSTVGRPSSSARTPSSVLNMPPDSSTMPTAAIRPQVASISERRDDGDATGSATGAALTRSVNHRQPRRRRISALMAGMT